MPPARNAGAPETSITEGPSKEHTGLRWPQPRQSEAEAQSPQPTPATSTSATPSVTTATPTKSAPRSRLRARKAVMSITPAASRQLRQLLSAPTPKLIRVGVKNRGCSGLAYHLEYVDQAGPLDERVEQDGVQVLVDSKALFSIIGSEMDWTEDKLSSRFVFRNPNIKEQCGCGESFMV
ncbi:MAG: Iron-sulfur assembly protein 1 [Phylliscum demangeonii]|nr:MAG: Iron-sulfur assembly protein 1 [Phylliscum demangeonii]